MSKATNIYQNRDPEAKFQIDSECRWFYGGTEIKRHAMVCLFSRYLKRDSDGAYNIITPHERVSVGVKGQNTTKAKVLELIYLGDHIRARLEVCGNDEFIVKIPNEGGLNIKENESISLSWASDDIRALDI